MPLVTRKVFVDTQSFVKAGLNFNSRAIDAFRNLCAVEDLEHLTTTVTISEVRNKIQEHIGEGLNKFNEFRRKAGILSGSTDERTASLFAELDGQEVERAALAIFDDFIADSRATVLNVSSVDPEEVFRRYFNQIAPFQSGKKKEEFPDAFVMLALAANLKEQESIYIVSEDGDLRAFCENDNRFISIDSLAKVLDHYNSHDNERSEFIKNYIVEKNLEIKAAIKQQVEGAEFYNRSTWEDSYVVAQSVLNVDEFEPDIIEIDDEFCIVALSTSIRYEVEVEGPDFVNAVYDREAGKLFSFGETKRKDEGEIKLPVEIEIILDVRDHKFVATDFNVSVMGLSGGVEVSVEETEYH